MRITESVLLAASFGLLAMGGATAAPAQGSGRTMSDIMVKGLYPTADAVFYIETRTPAGRGRMD
jgi:hypothetical protein